MFEEVERPGPEDPGYKSPWLHAHYDKLASLETQSPLCALLDVDGTGEGAFVAADYGKKKLRVFRGIRQTASVALPEVPTAICGFFPTQDDGQKKRLPCVAVACGSTVYVFKRLRPDCKIDLPPEKVFDDDEVDIWRASDKIMEKLKVLREENPKRKFSPYSMAAFALEGNVQKLADHVNTVLRLGVMADKESFVTCLCSIPKNQTEGGSHYLLVGTETKKFIVIDPKNMKVLTKVSLPSVPLVVRVSGNFDVDFRVVVGCRDAKIYSFTPGDKKNSMVLKKPIIELEENLVDLALTQKTHVAKRVFAATFEKRVHCFITAKARKEWSLPKQESAITSLAVFEVLKFQLTTVLVVALASGDLRIYNGKTVVDILRIGESLTAIVGGTYGREAHSLCLVTRSGGFLVKMLPRTADFETLKLEKPGPPPEQDIPLPIPKKSDFYKERLVYERENAVHVYRVMVQQYLRMKKLTLENYLKLLEAGELHDQKQVQGKNTKVQASAEVQGIGPNFHINITIDTTGTDHLYKVPVLVEFDRTLYKMPRELTVLNLLIPTMTFKCIFRIDCIDVPKQHASLDTRNVTVLICHPSEDNNSALAVINVTMPLSETLETP